MREKTLRTLEFEKVLASISEKASSDMGKTLIKNSRPYENSLKIKDELKKLQDAITLFMEKGPINVSDLADIRKDLHKASIGGIISISSLYDVKYLLSVANEVYDKYKDAPSENRIREMIEFLFIDASLTKRLEKTFVDRDTISNDATPLLKSLIRKKNLKNDEINNKLKDFVSGRDNEKYLQDSIITIREGRYVVPIKREYKNSVTGIVHDISASGGTYFIEPQKIVNLNNEIFALENEIEAEKKRILKDFSNEVGSKSESISSNIDVLSELDCIFAKAEYGIEFGYTLPTFTEKNIVDLKQAFHPLIAPEKVIKTDILIPEDTRAMIITGPNTGGKTVILKTVGIISALAQSAFMIPASDESRIPIFNDIYTDIGDEQSIEQSLSTFSAHIKNIIDILDHAKEKSLYLFDELGAGTDPTEGAALAMSIVDNLKAKDVKIIASTHYAELKVYALNTEGVVNGSMQFDVESLRPTYKLIIGIPGKSNAFEISRKLGLNEKYIDKAYFYLDDNALKFESALEEIEISRSEAESYRIKQEEKLERLNQLEKEKIDKLSRAEEKADKELNKAREEARSILEQAKKDYDDIIREANKTINTLNADSARKIQETRDDLRNKISSLEKSDKKVKKGNLTEEDLKLGDKVKIISLNQVGSVQTLPDLSGDLLIQVGILKVNSNIKDLLKVRKENSTQVTTKKFRFDKSKYIKPEIDLRGVDTEELYDRLDKYIDDAFIAGLKEVTILHGKGTGALRKATQESLRTNKHVESFRLGKIGEGDTGVTIARLK